MRRFLVLLSLAFISAAEAPAQTASWTGSQSTSWFSGGNWSPANVPGAGANVLLDPNPFTLTEINGGQTAELGAIQVGVNRLGDLSVFNGGQLRNSGVAMLGSNAEGFGFVDVTGSGSSWQIGLGLVVAERGSGSVRISDFGLVNNQQGRIGNLAGSIGSVDVIDGTWINTNLFVGYQGRGTLDIRSGGFVGNSAPAFLGYDNSGDGRIRVRGGSQWGSLSSVLIGRAGLGSVSVENAGQVTSTDLRLAVQPGSSGALTVTGSNSKWTAVGDLSVGLGGSAELAILNGGTVESNFAAVGDFAGSSGSVTITGTGSALIATTGLTLGMDGESLLIVGGGGRLTTGQVASIGSVGGAVLRLQANGQWTADLIRVGLPRPGTLSVGGVNSRLTANTVQIGADGRLALLGNGDLRARVIVDHGGHIQWAAQPTHPTIIHNLSLASGAVMQLPLGSASGFTGPALRIGFAGPGTGDLNLAGRLAITDAGGFGGAGSYLLMTYSGSLTQGGVIIQFPPLQPGLIPQIRTSTPGEVWLDILGGSDELFRDQFMAPDLQLPAAQ